MNLPPEAQRIYNTTLTPAERYALDCDRHGLGLRRTATAMSVTISAARHYRLSAWAKIGKELCAKPQRTT